MKKKGRKTKRIKRIKKIKRTRKKRKIKNRKSKRKIRIDIDLTLIDFTNYIKVFYLFCIVTFTLKNQYFLSLKFIKRRSKIKKIDLDIKINKV